MNIVYYFNDATQLKHNIENLADFTENEQLKKLIECFKEISDDYSKMIPETTYKKVKYDFYNELFHELDCICTKEYNSRFD